MKSRSIQMLTITAVFVGLAWCFSATHAQQNEQMNYTNLQVVPYANGSTGFFDERTGIIYVYDGRMDECVFIRKIEKLGEPLKHLRDPDVAKRKE